MASKKSARLTEEETQRWLKQVENWRRRNRYTHKALCEKINLKVYIYGCLRNNKVKTVEKKVADEAMDILSITWQSVYGKEGRANVLADKKKLFRKYKSTYTELAEHGEKEEASKIVRQAALLMYQLLILHRMPAKLTMRYNSETDTELMDVMCEISSDRAFSIKVFGGERYVEYCFCRSLKEVDIPLHDGVFDGSSVTLIRSQLQSELSSVEKKDSGHKEFVDKARKFADVALTIS